MTTNQPKDAVECLRASGEPIDRAEAAWEQVLVCPACRRRLTHRRSRFRCESCSREWAIANGVPVFAEQASYGGGIPRETVLKLNSLIEKEYWQAVLLESDDPTVRKAASAIVNPDVANWHWLMGLSPQARVLDLAAGLGTASQGLAYRFREVFALEAAPENVEFMRRRFAQDGTRNVWIVRTSPWEIPFPPRSFDLVVMNGLLPWAAAGRDGDPAQLQASLLEKAFEMLTPGGYLYLGTGNRLFWRYLIGAPEVYQGLPWASILPRRLANWYAERRGQPNGYRTYTHSSRGYHKILRRAGFQDITLYVALPTYETPRLIMPLKENVFSYYHTNFDPRRSGLIAVAASRLLSRLRLLKYVQHSFAIVARKESK